jgi:ribonuclease D
MSTETKNQCPAPPAPVLRKSDINLLPLKKWEGPVEIVDCDEHLRAVIPGLHGERVLGFDIEVRPTFRSGDHFSPALAQLAARDTVFLVQLKKIRDLAPLGTLFAADRVIKAGVAVAGDITHLHELLPFPAAGFVELGKLAGKKGIKAGGVRTLAASVLGCRISKGAQCSNWERSQLAPPQVAYAATDAWICREIYLALEKMPDIKAKSKPESSVGDTVSRK